MPGRQAGVVTEYRVGVHGWVTESPHSESSRFLDLRVAGARPERAVLFFVADDRWVSVLRQHRVNNPLIWRTVGEEFVGRVDVYLPLREFDAAYHILQTESPVTAEWLFFDVPGSWALYYFILMTGSEWPGEGYEDALRRTLGDLTDAEFRDFLEKGIRPSGWEPERPPI